MRNILLFTSLCWSCLMMAQSPVNFNAISSQQSDLSEEVKATLLLKVEQILGRNNAGAAFADNAFVIEPVLTIGEAKSTQGQIRNLSISEGELTLIAKNRYDGSVYNTTVVKVKGAATGDASLALKDMVRNIAVANPAYTRFIRTTRERIMAHYEANCEEILNRGRVMLREGNEKQGFAYLYSIPKDSPCYEEAAPLLGDYKVEEDTEEVAEEVILVEEAEDLSSVVIETVPEQKPDPVPTPQPAVQPVKPATSSGTYKLNVNNPDLEVKLLSCTADATTQTITIRLKVINHGNRISSGYTRLMEAIDQDGKSYGTSNGNSVNYPTDVEVTTNLTIHNVRTKVSKLNYVEVNLHYSRIELRDVPVTWK